jgi:hypothetical protein
MSGRCSFLALSPHQSAANGGKGRHKAKLEKPRILTGDMPDPATRGKSP